MKLTRKAKILLPVAGAGIVAALIYSFWHSSTLDNFSCAASLSQHYTHDNVDVSLSYTVRGTSGLISINGRSQVHPEKVFNRKISFTMHKEGDVYFMTSKSNLKFPDDNVDDTWLGIHEPDFFVYPEKSIYMRIDQQENNSYLFMIDTIPTYVCKSIEEE
ncbi:hypothetical protein [Rahnella sp. PCH160]|uniref:hypothetical protein n=1 Tax=Rahnella sp. PCH160 TaxID=3447928 RepID=UPI0039FCE479